MPADWKEHSPAGPFKTQSVFVEPLSAIK